MNSSQKAVSSMAIDWFSFETDCLREEKLEANMEDFNQ